MEKCQARATQTYLCVLLVSGEAASKQNKRLHLLQELLTTITISRHNSGHRTDWAGLYNIAGFPGPHSSQSGTKGSDSLYMCIQWEEGRQNGKSTLMSHL